MVIKKYLAPFGLHKTPVFLESFNPGTTDFRASLSKIAFSKAEELLFALDCREL